MFESQEYMHLNMYVKMKVLGRKWEEAPNMGNGTSKNIKSWIH